MKKWLEEAWPQLLRAAAMAMAALSLTWGVTVSGGLVSAMIGAALGVVVGQRLGKSRARMPVIVVGVLAVLAGGWALAGMAVGNEGMARALGPATALHFASIARFGALSFALTAGFRAVAARRPTAVAAELGFIGLAITTVFASHRDGVIARPLWLSDWAWKQGMDPATLLLGVGVVAVGVLSILLLLETKSGRALSSLVVLAIMATIAILSINFAAQKPPEPMNDLGLKNAPEGDTPPPQPPSDGGSGHDPNSADGGQKPATQDDGGAGQPSTAAAGDGGAGQPQDGGDGGGAQPQDGGDGGGAQPDGGDGGEGQGADGGLDGGQQDGGDDGGGVPAQQQDGGSDDQNGGQPPPPQDQLDQQNQDGPSNSPQPVAVVLLDDDYSPPAQGYYFREEALSQFNGTRLVASGAADFDRDQMGTFPTERTKVGQPPEPAGRSLVHATVVLLHDHPHPFALESPVVFAPAPNPNPARFVRAYKFESLSQATDYKKLFGKKAGDKRWSPETLAYYTQPSGDPRFKELAEKIVKPLPPHRKGDPFAQAVAVKLWMDKNLTYSTKERHAGRADPTADFLFGNKIGYCVHFAHAAVYMWRSLGIPARIGVGYMTSEDSRQGGSTILIRGGDAHAWPEIYLEGIGWVVLDISAEKNLDKPGQPVDDDLQRLLGEMARNNPPDPTEPPPKAPRKPSHFGRDLGIAGLWLLAAALVVMYAIKIWRRFAPVFVRARHLPRVGYRTALDVLTDAGIQREIGETREAFADRIVEVTPSFEKLTDMHVAARLRDPSLDPATRPELQAPAWKETLRAVRREVSSQTKAWRRWLGALNPVSFMDSR